MKGLRNFDISVFEHLCVYLRVSTRKQSLDIKCGLPQQKLLCDQWINNSSSLNKSNISYWEDIGSSYKNEKVLTEMNQMLKKMRPKSLIIISEVSRLGRSKNMVMKILKNVLNKKSGIYSVGENLTFGIGKILNKKFISRIEDSEKESDTLSMRVKNSQYYIKTNGGHIGKPPFGYKVVRNYKNIPVLQENPEHFKLIDTMIRLVDESLAYSQIANLMNNNNQLHENKLWTGTKIRFILTKFYPEHLTKSIEEQNIMFETKSYIDNYQSDTHLMELYELNDNYLTLRSGKYILKTY